MVRPLRKKQPKEKVLLVTAMQTATLVVVVIQATDGIHHAKAPIVYL